jgi:hypothetical protein
LVFFPSTIAVHVTLPVTLGKGMGLKPNPASVSPSPGYSPWVRHEQVTGLKPERTFIEEKWSERNGSRAASSIFTTIWKELKKKPM